MDAPQDIMVINSRIKIPHDQFVFKYSSSSGPGGQHVNRSATKVELQFDLENCPQLSLTQKNKIKKYLASHINKKGILRFVSEESRSQSQNRQNTLERFRQEIAKALKPQKKRRPTQPTTGSKEKRLSDKKKKGQVKKKRQSRDLDE